VRFAFKVKTVNNNIANDWSSTFFLYNNTLIIQGDDLHKNLNILCMIASITEVW